MSVRFWIIIIGILVLYNIYNENNIFKRFNQYTKYYKMAIVVAMTMGALKIANNSPSMSYQNMKSLHDFIQVMPIDRNSKDLFTPFFSPDLKSDMMNTPPKSYDRITTSGKKSSKRSVSETKKKYVASQQNWKCAHCQNQLTAWFEVDHVQRLEYGGSNNVENLEALCRECHGKKTSMENM